MKVRNTQGRIAILSMILIVGVMCLTQSGIAKETELRVITADAPLRLEPKAGSTVVSKLKIGAVLTAETKSGEWYRVNLPPNEDGYVISGYIHQKDVSSVEQGSTAPREPEPQKVGQAQTPTTPAPQAAESAKRRKLSLKLTLGFGFGFESIETGAYKIYEDRTEPITLHPGGGGNFGVDFGYLFTENVKLELGIGIQNSGVIAGEEQVTFSRMPLTLTLSYKFPSARSFNVYIGGGGGLYNAPEVKYDVDNFDINVKYDSSFGIHGLVGLVKRPKGKNWFFFGELRYVAVFNYKWKTATYHGMSFPLYSSDPFAEFGGNGIFINFGIGWLF